MAAIAEANGIRDPDRIVAGRTIVLPMAAPPPAGAGRSHTVARGDTLAGIAAAWGTTVDDLAARNGLADPDLIVIGQRLTLPGWHCPVVDAAC